MACSAQFFRILFTGITIFAAIFAVWGCANVHSNSVTDPPSGITISINPTSASVEVSKQQPFSAVVRNTTNTGVTWQVNGVAGGDSTHGTIDSAGMFTAPAAVPSPAAVTVTAVSQAQGSKTASASVTITAASAAISVAVAPTSASVQTGKTLSVTATLQNDTQGKGVSWSLTGSGCSGATCGTLSTASSLTGVAITYTAPSAVPSPASVTLKATSVADSSKTASVALTITSATSAGISVSVNPTSASVQTGQNKSITATVQNDAQNKGVTWTLTGTGCSGATCGTLSATSSASGTAINYTAPSAVPSPATVKLTAKSVTDTTKSASATFTITATSTGNVSVTISPKRVGLTTGQAQTFTATVSGSTNTNVTWEVDTIPGGNSSVGTINSSGAYSPPSSPGTHNVGARSVADSTASATASAAITDLGGVYTYHNDLSRDGVNAKEYALTTTTVADATFGKRFACSIDAAAYAQPLWVANVSIGGGTHNIVIAATQHDTVYAFDADASPCHTYWQKSLLGSGETWVTSGDVGTTDINPDIGIVGTPVIDPSTKTLYVVAKSKSGSTFHQRLHALSLADGSEKFSGPKDIAFSSGGITFSALRQNDRCALALVNGVVYIAYASHGDNGPYYGWVVGYSASTLAQVSVYNDAPVGAADGKNAGIWMAGGGPAADSSGNLYVITGNGPFNTANHDFGDSFLKISTSGGLSEASFFTPHNEGSLDAADQDLGAGGATLLVDAPSSPTPRLVIGGGKEGILYVLNRDNLGGHNSTDDSGAVQTFPLGNGIFATPAFWQNTMYIGLVGGHVKAFAFDPSTGKFNISPTSQSPDTSGFPGSTPSVSSQGTSNGIVWTIERVSGSPSILHAFDATNLNNQLWNSAGNSADHPGGSVKFTVPTVANGKVYVGTSSEISVYGLKPD